MKAKKKKKDEHLEKQWQEGDDEGKERKKDEYLEKQWQKGDDEGQKKKKKKDQRKKWKNTMKTKKKYWSFSKTSIRLIISQVKICSPRAKTQTGPSSMGLILPVSNGIEGVRIISLCSLMSHPGQDREGVRKYFTLLKRMQSYYANLCYFFR